MLSTQIVAMDLPTCMLSDRPCCRVGCRHISFAGSYTINDVEERWLRMFDHEGFNVGYIGLTTHQPLTRFHDMPDEHANHFPRWRAMFVVMVGGRVTMRSLEGFIVERLKEA